MTGVPPSGSGLRPFGVEPQDASQAEPLVPNATISSELFRAIGDLVCMVDTTAEPALALEILTAGVNELYGCVADGVFGPLDERAEIVAWLRGPHHPYHYRGVALRIERGEHLASAMSAFGQDAEERLEAKPANAVPNGETPR